MRYFTDREATGSSTTQHSGFYDPGGKAYELSMTALSLVPEAVAVLLDWGERNGGPASVRAFHVHFRQAQREAHQLIEAMLAALSQLDATGLNSLGHATDGPSESA